MNEIRLAALDLDGTLLDRTSRITPRTLDALTEAIRRGVVVLPATGRALSSLPRVAAAIPGVRYAVTSNGAAVWDLGADPLAALRSRYGEPGPGPVAEPVCLYRRTLPADTARAVYRLLEQYEGELNFFVDGRTLKTPAGMAWTRARMARMHSTEAKQADDGRFTILPDLHPYFEAHAGEVEKFCMFFASPSEAERVLPLLAAVPGVEVTQGAPDNVEATAAGVTKGTALLALAGRLGIPQGQVLAVGDSENDRKMLEAAGVAAVMANGMPSVKALADIVSQRDCDHDGVAELFARLGLTGP